MGTFLTEAIHIVENDDGSVFMYFRDADSGVTTQVNLDRGLWQQFRQHVSSTSGVRLKFQCTEKAVTLYGTRVELHPSYGSGSTTDENKRFWNATPTGSLGMLIKNEAADSFDVGKHYYIDLSEAPE